MLSISRVKFAPTRPPTVEKLVRDDGEQILLVVLATPQVSLIVVVQIVGSNRPVSTYRLLGGFVFIFVYFLVLGVLRPK